MSRKVVTCQIDVATKFVEVASEEVLQRHLSLKLQAVDRKLYPKGYQWTQDWQLVVRHHPVIYDEEGYPKEVQTYKWRYVYEREFSAKNQK